MNINSIFKDISISSLWFLFLIYIHRSNFIILSEFPFSPVNWLLNMNERKKPLYKQILNALQSGKEKDRWTKILCFEVKFKPHLEHCNHKNVIDYDFNASIYLLGNRHVRRLLYFMRGSTHLNITMADKQCSEIFSEICSYMLHRYCIPLGGGGSKQKYKSGELRKPRNPSQQVTRYGKRFLLSHVHFPYVDATSR